MNLELDEAVALEFDPDTRFSDGGVLLEIDDQPSQREEMRGNREPSDKLCQRLPPGDPALGLVSTHGVERSERRMFDLASSASWEQVEQRLQEVGELIDGLTRLAPALEAQGSMTCSALPSRYSWLFGAVDGESPITLTAEERWLIARALWCVMPICPVLLESSPDKHERVESMKRDVEGKGILIKLVNSIPGNSKAPEDDLVRQTFEHLVRRAYDPVAERGRPKKNK